MLLFSIFWGEKEVIDPLFPLVSIILRFVIAEVSCLAFVNSVCPSPGSQEAIASVSLPFRLPLIAIYIVIGLITAMIENMAPHHGQKKEEIEAEEKKEEIEEEQQE